MGHLCSVKQAAGDDRASVKIEPFFVFDFVESQAANSSARNNAIEPEYTLLNSIRYQALVDANARTKRHRTPRQDLLLPSVRLLILVQVG